METEALFTILGAAGAVAGFIPIGLEMIRKLRAGKQADSVTVRHADGRTSIAAGGQIGAVFTGDSAVKRREEPILLDPANEKDIDRVLSLLDDPKKRGES
ncbi:hypothetical protein HTV45_03655 [Streptomyces sp. CHD11]|uniref:hypothetical protein n=1 Tax=Streptomyces sp. CHD11 TaxID=2741325 RepID=UPI001BFC92DF|nr:hypothetical protein [Streptomyces sp. CHD11]MBT3150009.1 hypothetical protein [Streptomyces sp. CHD11]